MGWVIAILCLVVFGPGLLGAVMLWAQTSKRQKPTYAPQWDCSTQEELERLRKKKESDESWAKWRADQEAKRA